VNKASTLFCQNKKKQTLILRKVVVIFFFFCGQDPRRANTLPETKRPGENKSELFSGKKEETYLEQMYVEK
jgi:hypothetical protein